jgi:2,3-bisphosphoglycerate-independent phosphoglycerate mutase
VEAGIPKNYKIRSSNYLPMKYVVFLGDGMADYPLEELGGKTPLQVAETPNMDAIAINGRCGLLRTIPDGMGPGSDIANLSILGYDPRGYYTGRGPLEAASIGVMLKEGEVAFRCNLITESEGRIADYSAGHISTEEARELIEALREKLLDYGRFHPGVSYRHLFVSEGGDELVCTPPHDVVGGGVEEFLIKPRVDPLAVRLNEMILKSRDLLAKHPVNREREKAGKSPANMIWLWGQGPRPKMEPLKEKYGIRGAVVSAVDLLKGIGVYAGMEVVDVPGATGYYDTNYEGKAKYALQALERNDYVYLHVEAIDEAGHAGDVEKKIECIEEFDRRVVGRVLEGLSGDYTVAVLPDHATPISVKTHTRDMVPFAIYSTDKEGDAVGQFDEESVKKGAFGTLEGVEFMKTLLGK